MTERQLLDAAREGDQDAFARLIDAHRAALYVHCYRMLGSPQDAEDALQEALLRAWRGLARFESRSPLRPWLYAIATNASLRTIERRPRRVLPVDHGPAADPHDNPGEPLTESIWIEPLPDSALQATDTRAAPAARYEERESVELAFIAALQMLPPRQRAVLIMRDVLGFSGGEVAAALETTPASVYSALQRAHRTIEDGLPSQSQQQTLRAVGDAGLREIVTRYVEAWDRGDVAALAAMLTEDAAFSMPPHSMWFRGRDVIAGFLARVPLRGGRIWTSLPTRANGQPAIAQYAVDADTGAVSGHSITVLTLRECRIDAVTAFLMPELLPRFGLTPPPRQ